MLLARLVLADLVSCLGGGVLAADKACVTVDVILEAGDSVSGNKSGFLVSENVRSSQL